jgi:hypothetical protein
MQVISVRPSHLFSALGAVAIGAALLIWSPWSAQARGEAAFATPRASNVAMNCAPGQQALVRQHVVSGELNVAVECAGQPSAAAAAYRTDFEQPAVAQAPRVVPAVYRAPEPVRAYRPRAVSQPRPVASRVEPKRDWKKDVLIVGGSAGAGAGIGAIAGGKKGAAIGAAIGGGSAALWRVLKH